LYKVSRPAAEKAHSAYTDVGRIDC